MKRERRIKIIATLGPASSEATGATNMVRIAFVAQEHVEKA